MNNISRLDADPRVEQLVDSLTSSSSSTKDLRHQLHNKLGYLRENIGNPDALITLQLRMFYMHRLDLFRDDSIVQILKTLLKSSSHGIRRTSVGKSSESILLPLISQILFSLHKDLSSWPLDFLELYLDDSLGSRSWVDASESQLFVRNLTSWVNDKREMSTSTVDNGQYSHFIDDMRSNRSSSAEHQSNYRMNSGNVILVPGEMSNRYEDNYYEVLDLTLSVLYSRCDASISIELLRSLDCFVPSIIPNSGNIKSSSYLLCAKQTQLWPLISTITQFINIREVKVLIVNCLDSWFRNAAIQDNVKTLVVTLAASIDVERATSSSLNLVDDYIVESLIKHRLRSNPSEPEKRAILALIDKTPEILTNSIFNILYDDIWVNNSALKTESVKLICLLMQQTLAKDKIKSESKINGIKDMYRDIRVSETTADHVVNLFRSQMTSTDGMTQASDILGRSYSIFMQNYLNCGSSGVQAKGKSSGLLNSKVGRSGEVPSNLRKSLNDSFVRIVRSLCAVEFNYVSFLREAFSFQLIDLIPNMPQNTTFFENEIIILLYEFSHISQLLISNEICVIDKEMLSRLPSSATGSVSRPAQASTSPRPPVVSSGLFATSTTQHKSANVLRTQSNSGSENSVTTTSNPNILGDIRKLQCMTEIVLIQELVTKWLLLAMKNQFKNFSSYNMSNNNNYTYCTISNSGHLGNNYNYADRATSVPSKFHPAILYFSNCSVCMIDIVNKVTNLASSQSTVKIPFEPDRGASAFIHDYGFVSDDLLSSLLDLTRLTCVSPSEIMKGLSLIEAILARSIRTNIDKSMKAIFIIDSESIVNNLFSLASIATFSGSESKGEVEMFIPRSDEVDRLIYSSVKLSNNKRKYTEDSNLNTFDSPEIIKHESQSVFAHKDIYWKMCVSLFLLACGETANIGSFLWDFVPDLSAILKMCLEDRFTATSTSQPLTLNGCANTIREDENVIIEIDDMSTNKGQQVTQYGLLDEEKLIVFNTTDSARAPPEDTISAIQQFSSDLKLGNRLRVCTSPDFIVRLINLNTSTDWNYSRTREFISLNTINIQRQQIKCNLGWLLSSTSLDSAVIIQRLPILAVSQLLITMSMKIFEQGKQLNIWSLANLSMQSSTGFGNSNILSDYKDDKNTISSTISSLNQIIAEKNKITSQAEKLSSASFSSLGEIRAESKDLSVLLYLIYSNPDSVVNMKSIISLAIRFLVILFSASADDSSEHLKLFFLEISSDSELRRSNCFFLMALLNNILYISEQQMVNESLKFDCGEVDRNLTSLFSMWSKLLDDKSTINNKTLAESSINNLLDKNVFSALDFIDICMAPALLDGPYFANYAASKTNWLFQNISKFSSFPKLLDYHNDNNKFGDSLSSNTCKKRHFLRVLERFVGSKPFIHQRSLFNSYANAIATSMSFESDSELIVRSLSDLKSLVDGDLCDNSYLSTSIIRLFVRFKKNFMNDLLFQYDFMIDILNMALRFLVRCFKKTDQLWPYIHLGTIRDKTLFSIDGDETLDENFYCTLPISDPRSCNSQMYLFVHIELVETLGAISTLLISESAVSENIATQISAITDNFQFEMKECKVQYSAKYPYLKVIFPLFITCVFASSNQFTIERMVMPILTDILYSNDEYILDCALSHVPVTCILEVLSTYRIVTPRFRLNSIEMINSNSSRFGIRLQILKNEAEYPIDFISIHDYESLTRDSKEFMHKLKALCNSREKLYILQQHCQNYTGKFCNNIATAFEYFDKKIIQTDDSKSIIEVTSSLKENQNFVQSSSNYSDSAIDCIINGINFPKSVKRSRFEQFWELRESFELESSVSFILDLYCSYIDEISRSFLSSDNSNYGDIIIIAMSCDQLSDALRSTIPDNFTKKAFLHLLDIIARIPLDQFICKLSSSKIGHNSSTFSTSALSEDNHNIIIGHYLFCKLAFSVHLLSKSLFSHEKLSNSFDSIIIDCVEFLKQQLQAIQTLIAKMIPLTITSDEYSLALSNFYIVIVIFHYIIHNIEDSLCQELASEFNKVYFTICLVFDALITTIIMSSIQKPSSKEYARLFRVLRLALNSSISEDTGHNSSNLLMGELHCQSLGQYIKSLLSDCRGLHRIYSTLLNKKTSMSCDTEIWSIFDFMHTIKHNMHVINSSNAFMSESWLQLFSSSPKCGYCILSTINQEDESINFDENLPFFLKSSELEVISLKICENIRKVKNSLITAKALDGAFVPSTINGNICDAILNLVDGKLNTLSHLEISRFLLILNSFFTGISCIRWTLWKTYLSFPNLTIQYIELLSNKLGSTKTLISSFQENKRRRRDVSSESSLTNEYMLMQIFHHCILEESLHQSVSNTLNLGLQLVDGHLRSSLQRFINQNSTIRLKSSVESSSALIGKQESAKALLERMSFLWHNICHNNSSVDVGNSVNFHSKHTLLLTFKDDFLKFYSILLPLLTVILASLQSIAQYRQSTPLRLPVVLKSTISDLQYIKRYSVTNAVTADTTTCSAPSFSTAQSQFGWLRVLVRISEQLKSYRNHPYITLAQSNNQVFGKCVSEAFSNINKLAAILRTLNEIGS